MNRQAPLDVSKHLPPGHWFARWWSPAELFALVRDHNELVPSELLFTRPDLRPLLEAYAASRFATILDLSAPCEIRLPTDRFPDFELRTDGTVRQFELTEADHAGRKRGDEYREAAVRRLTGVDPKTELFDPTDEEEAAIPAIARAMELKAKKGYRPPPELLVYVNFPLFRELQLTSNQAIWLAEPWRDSFSSIWLLWGATAVRCWPNPAKIVDRDAGRASG